jgi:hypothetical protein
MKITTNYKKVKYIFKLSAKPNNDFLQHEICNIAKEYIRVGIIETFKMLKDN